MSVEAILVGAWLFGWAALTIFAAAVIGNAENVRGSGVRDFPTFVFPLFFGWGWPAMLAIILICAPLAWLSDRASRDQSK